MPMPKILQQLFYVFEICLRFINSLFFGRNSSFYSISFFPDKNHVQPPKENHSRMEPTHYEDMSWSPSSRNFRSPGSSPETYRRIIRSETTDNFPKDGEEKFFSNEDGRRSPTLSRRIFKEVWNDDASDKHRFPDRPKMFKRVFRPSRWEDEESMVGSEIPHLRRMERHFDENRPRKFDEEFQRRMFKDVDEEDFEDKAEGKVHHIPIMVEKRIEELRKNFGKQPPAADKTREEDCEEDWTGPQVHRLRKNFEQDGFLPRSHRFARGHERHRPFASSVMTETWDPHAVHTLPTRRGHKSQSFDDSQHTVPPPKQVFRSYSETYQEAPKPQGPPHSAAFRSHSDGHCPNQTYVTKIEVQHPNTEADNNQSNVKCRKRSENNASNNPSETNLRKSISKSKFDHPALQQIAVVLQNVEDLVMRIESYTGTGRDKQYRFLDEMLTRCMLRLDDIDPEGREDVRNARKAAIRDVQNCIDKLEAKADESEMKQQQAKAKENVKPQTSEVLPPQSSPETSNGAIPLGHAPISNQAIPLSDIPSPKKAIPLENVGNGAIPLGDSSKCSQVNTACNTTSASQAIPLADVPMSDLPIPLPDVPRDTKMETSPEKSISRQNSNEQTKL